MANSDKRSKFVELAENRVNRAIKDLRLIGNLSNGSAYEFTEADIRKMFRTLQRELDAAKGRFSRGERSKEDGFRIG